jgi:PadR family transcriptional regulator, regulatory protein PadR
MPSARFPIPKGTLDRSILQVLSLEGAHGYAIAQRLQQVSRDTVTANQGSLHRALRRLEQKKWLKDWGSVDGGGPADFRGGHIEA